VSTGWFRLANNAFEVAQNHDVYAFIVYAYLVRCAPGSDKGGWSWPRQDNMGSELGISQSSVERAIKSLKSGGVIEVIRQANQDNAYRVLWHGAAVSQTDANGEQPSHRREPAVSQTDERTSHRRPRKKTQGKRHKKKTQHQNGHQDDFVHFWQIVPHKVGKRAAEKAYRAAVKHVMAEHGIPAVEAHQLIRDRMEAFAATPQAQGKFCPHPSTWLNAGRYDDEPAQPKVSRVATADDAKNWNPYE